MVCGWMDIVSSEISSGEETDLYLLRHGATNLMKHFSSVYVISPSKVISHLAILEKSAQAATSPSPLTPNITNMQLL